METERTDIRYVVKKISSVKEFFGQYRKIFFEATGEEEIEKITKTVGAFVDGDTSLYLKNGSEEKLLGNFELSMDVANIANYIKFAV